MAPTALVVLTTLATDADARTLVTALLAERLIACGTLLPGGRSMYRWEGEVNEESGWSCCSRPTCRGGRRCAGRYGSGTRTRCPSCSLSAWIGGSSRTCHG